MKTVLITGASSGIGKETAYVYAENNYNLVLVARRKENLEAIKSEIEENNKVKVNIFDIDLARTNSAEELYKKVNDANLKIDVLINNAGFGIDGYFKDMDINRIENMLILNIITLTKLTRLFVNDMLKNKSGHIINIASMAAYQGIPKFASYSASKSYVLNFTEAIAHELKSHNIKVTVINPGATQSEFAEVANAKHAAFNNAPTSKELADFIFNSMKKAKVNANHGFKNNFLNFFSRFMPRKIVVNIAAKMME